MDRIGSFGIVGLGKMGADLALNALHHGYGWSEWTRMRSPAT